MANDWLELRQHAGTGIETIKAHFEGACLRSALATAIW